MPLHPDTLLPTVFVYDGHPGGAGFAERAFHTARGWLTATRQAIASCECEAGCPSCIQSPKCGNGNDPLHKRGAVRLLGELLRSAPAGSGRAGRAGGAGEPGPGAVHGEPDGPGTASGGPARDLTVGVYGPNRTRAVTSAISPCTAHRTTTAP